MGLYHVGNNPEAHGWIVEALARNRGVVVLHDFVLHHLVAGLTLGRGDSAEYLEAMQRDAGVVGRLLAHGVIDGVVPPLWEVRPQDFPLVDRVLDHASGVIVHSRAVERLVRDAGYAAPVSVIPHPAWEPPAELHDAALPSDRLVVACVGHLNPSKRIPQLLEAFVRVRARLPAALLVLAGEPSQRVDLDGWVREAGGSFGEDVLALGYVDEPRLWSVLSRCDVCVNLRSPTMGETSGVVIRALSVGRPVVVTDVGWFSELPDEVATKIPVGEGEVEELERGLESLLSDAERRRQMGERARDYVRAEHDLERVAELYAQVLEEASGGEAVEEAVLRSVAAAAVEIGAEDEEIRLVGSRAREVLRGD